jgi:hypothetical protein
MMIEYKYEYGAAKVETLSYFGILHSSRGYPPKYFPCHPTPWGKLLPPWMVFT